MNKKVIVIAGPTAAGKTALAIEVAKHFGTEIISADSRQCYREMNIGVARPSEEELSIVAHHFIASHSIHEKVTAALFESYALEKTANIIRKNNVVVMVGGTGLYIKAFCEGLDHIPEVPEEVHHKIIQAYQANGLAWLQSELQRKDPMYFSISDEIQNPQRLMRALEVIEATGNSITVYRKGNKVKRDFDIIKIAITPSKERLYQQINQRVEKMIETGLLDEVKALIHYQHLNALQTVGYKELFDYYKETLLLPEAVELIKQNTRQYAKRQLTWFRKDKEFHWFEPGQTEEIIAYIKSDY